MYWYYSVGGCIWTQVKYQFGVWLYGHRPRGVYLFFLFTTNIWFLKAVQIADRDHQYNYMDVSIAICRYLSQHLAKFLHNITSSLEEIICMVLHSKSF